MGLVSFLYSSKSVSKLLWLPHTRTPFPYLTLWPWNWTFK